MSLEGVLIWEYFTSSNDPCAKKTSGFGGITSPNENLLQTARSPEYYGYEDFTCVYNYNILYIYTFIIHIISYHIISYHLISYHIMSYRIIAYPIVSYHIISYHIYRQYTYVHLCTIIHMHIVLDMHEGE